MPKIAMIVRNVKKREEKFNPGRVELKLKTNLEKPKLTLIVKKNKH